MLERIKLHRNPIFFVLTVIMTGTLGFGLGRLSRLEERREPVRIIESTATVSTANKAPISNVAGGTYVASQNGTRYYLPTCSGVNRIKEENKVYFASREAAEKAGLQPAANCPGI